MKWYGFVWYGCDCFTPFYPASKLSSTTLISFLDLLTWRLRVVASPHPCFIYQMFTWPLCVEPRFLLWPCPFSLGFHPLHTGKMICGDMAKFVLIWHDALWWGRCGDVICLNFVWCGMICCDMAWFVLMMRYDMVWFGTTWYDVVWYDVTLRNLCMAWCSMICCD